TDIRKTAHMMILKCFVDCFIQVTKIDLICSESGDGGSDFIEFASQILTLLIGSLSCRWKRSELAVNLNKQLVEFAEVKSARLVLVVLLEQFIETLQMSCSLWETLADFLCHTAPILEGNVKLVWVL